MVVSLLLLVLAVLVWWPAFTRAPSEQARNEAEQGEAATEDLTRWAAPTGIEVVAAATQHPPLPIGPFRVIRPLLEQRGRDGDAAAALVMYLALDACGNHRSVAEAERDASIARSLEFQLDVAMQLLAVEQDDAAVSAAIENHAEVELDELRALARDHYDAIDTFCVGEAPSDPLHGDGQLCHNYALSWLGRAALAGNPAARRLYLRNALLGVDIRAGLAEELVERKQVARQILALGLRDRDPYMLVMLAHVHHVGVFGAPDLELAYAYLLTAHRLGPIRPLSAGFEAPAWLEFSDHSSRFRVSQMLNWYRDGLDAAARERARARSERLYAAWQPGADS